MYRVSLSSVGFGVLALREVLSSFTSSPVFTPTHMSLVLVAVVSTPNLRHVCYGYAERFWSESGACWRVSHTVPLGMR